MRISEAEQTSCSTRPCISRPTSGSVAGVAVGVAVLGLKDSFEQASPHAEEVWFKHGLGWNSG